MAELIDALKFVQGAVAKKDFVLELTHFRIRDNAIMATNGALTMSHPIDLDIEACPNAIIFSKAINACHDTVAMNLTKAERISIKSGKFRAFVPCMPDLDDNFFTWPEGNNSYSLSEKDAAALIAGISSVAAFMSIDASRPWSRGVYFANQIMSATNNIIAVQAYTGVPCLLPIIFPAEFVQQVLSIKEHPIGIQYDERSCTFWYGDKKWVRTKLIDAVYPEQVEFMLNDLGTDANPQELSDEVFTALDDLKPFMDESNSVFISESRMSTSDVDGDGASYELGIKNATDGTCFDLRQLQLLDIQDIKIDLTMYPKPCYFTGLNIRGIAMGRRK